MATQPYTYKTGTYNNLELHTIKADARNIKLILQSPVKSMKNSGREGCNGGFFGLQTGIPSTIAVSDGTALCGTNSDNGRGCICWNGFNLTMETGIATVNDLSAYLGDFGSWGQGGFNLRLGSSSWREDLQADEWLTDKFLDNSGCAGRTAMVANVRTNEVHLIVTNSKATVPAFRTAVMKLFSISDSATENSTYKGILLDGSGSSQMRANVNGTVTDVATGDKRGVAQIIAIRTDSEIG